jgi:YggT family protein
MDIRIILYYILLAFNLVLLARVLLSWFPNIPRDNPVVRIVFQVTEPVLRPIRNALPQTGGFDFSPLIVFLIISVLTRFLL